MADESTKCAACGGPIEGDGTRTSKGLVCKWCRSIENVERDRDAPRPAPMTYTQPSSQGMSPITIIRIVLLFAVLLLAFARKC